MCGKLNSHTYLSRRATKLFHELVNSHDGSWGWGLGGNSVLLAGTVDFDMASRIVVLALDSPVGTDVGLAGVMCGNLTRGKRHPRYEARQGRIVGRDSGAGARRIGYLSELETIVSSGAHESSNSRVVILGQVLSVFTDSSGEGGFDQGLEGISQWSGVLNAKGSMTQGSSIERGRGRVECGLANLLLGVVGAWVKMSGLHRVSHVPTLNKKELTGRPLPSNPLRFAFPGMGSRIIMMLDNCPFSESLKCFCLLPR